MSLKFIRVPAPIVIAEATPGAPELGQALTWSLAEGVTYLVDNAPEFGRPQGMVRLGDRLVAAFDAPIDGVVELREDDWKALTAVVEAGVTAWGSWSVVTSSAAGVTTTPLQVPPRRFLPFSNAIAEAANQAPKDPNP